MVSRVLRRMRALGSRPPRRGQVRGSSHADVFPREGRSCRTASTEHNPLHLVPMPHVCDFSWLSASSIVKVLFYLFYIVLKNISCYTLLLASHREDFREDTAAMAPPPYEPALERRRLADRRTRPTTLWSALRWQGRRTGFRRAGEGRHGYVDGLARRTVALTLLVVVGSVLDAILTLLHLEDGGSEANPLMHVALTHGPTAFVVLKLVAYLGAADNVSRLLPNPVSEVTQAVIHSRNPFSSPHPARLACL